LIGHASPWRPGRREREQASGGLAGAEHTGWDRCDHSRRDVGWGRTRTGSGAGRCRPRATTRSASAPRPCQVPARPRRVVGAACPPSYQNLRRSICTSFFTCSRTAAGALAAGEADQSGGIGISINSWGRGRTTRKCAHNNNNNNESRQYTREVPRLRGPRPHGCWRWCQEVAGHASRSLRDRRCRHASLETAALSAPVSACQRLSAPVSAIQIKEYMPPKPRQLLMHTQRI